MSPLTGVYITEENQITHDLLTQECLKFIVSLQREFNKTRKTLLQERQIRDSQIDKGMVLGFPKETENIRKGDWKVSPPPKDIERRWIEITGPPQPKMCINAMNSGADVFMADFEDSLAPTWHNQMSGQKTLIDLNKRTLTFTGKQKVYKLSSDSSKASLFVRPRGWHLEEHHLIIDGEPVSASLFDFAVYFFHNLTIRLNSGCGGVYFYLPKLEAYKEARLWNSVFFAAEKYMNVPVGTIRCTVLIETLGGGLQMEEFLYELKEHIVGLNAGRWDYIFSAIKMLKNNKKYVLPDRMQVTMTVPFMRAYTNRLIQVCHKRGAHAIGGMSAFIPAKDQSQNEFAFNKITEDKTREVQDGFDGSWVAHPGMVTHAREIFEKYLNGQNHQKHVTRSEIHITAEDITNLTINKPITDAGVRGNINIVIQYMYYWLTGTGAVGLHNLMEDAATAEISRSQLWQWIKHHCKTASGILINEELYRYLNQFENYKDYNIIVMKRMIRDEELTKLRPFLTNKIALERAVEITDKIILSDHFADFLTTEAYPILNYLSHHTSSTSPKL